MMMRKLFIALALIVSVSPALVTAQELDLDSLVDAQETQAADPASQYGPGDDEEFSASTEDDITSLENGDLYKNNSSLFKVISIASKGEKGGTFTMQRIGGTNDPSPSWARTSGSGPPSIITRESLWDLYLAAGWTMHAIAGCLFVTIILGVNSLWIYRRGRQCPPRFVEQAQTALQQRDLGQLQELTHDETGLLGGICRAMVTRFETSTLQDISDRCDLEAGRYVRVLRVPLNGLSLISAIAPLLGLLGTVIGIVTCFDTIAYEAASASKSQALASGIRVALFTTVGGLTVAIPAQVTLFISNLKLTTVVSECEFIAEQFLHEVALIKRAEQPAPVVMAAAPVARKKRRAPTVVEGPVTESALQTAGPVTAPESVAAAERAAHEEEPVAAVLPASVDPSESAVAPPEASTAAPPESIAQVAAAQSDHVSAIAEQQPAAAPTTPSEPSAAPAAAVPKPVRGKSKKSKGRSKPAVAKPPAAAPTAKPVAGGFVSGGLVSNEEFESQLEEVRATPATSQAPKATPAPAPPPAVVTDPTDDDEDGIEFTEWSE
jgi:biopolymer transport protein ExbB